MAPNDFYDVNYPSDELLRLQAKKRVPKFAFEYVDGGCNAEIALRKNTKDIRKLELIPYYLRRYQPNTMETKLFGETYSAPFGVCPIGLQGLIWPRSAEILAQAAFAHNIPFILSTVTTAAIEDVAKLTEGKAWFQLYHPAEDKVTDDILERCHNSGIKTLVVLSDVPTFAYRPKEIKNGLAMPPRMTLSNIINILASPKWALQTLLAGKPEFKTLKKYMQDNMNMHHLAQFMDKTFDGRLSTDRLKRLREKWKGNLVLKGLSTVEDAEVTVSLGFDGIIISNHGGRQLDSGPSAINTAFDIVKAVKGKTTVMMDSGIRSGSDIACCMSSGVDFTFLGRTFMYGVGALGKNGGNHTINMLKKQLQQVMEQCCCEKTTDFPDYLNKKTTPYCS